MGAVADDLQELLEEERESGMLPSFDLQTLFDNVVPQLLTMTGESGNRVMISAVRANHARQNNHSFRDERSSSLVNTSILYKAR